jgi:anthranilate phosphoribosyltransferase
VHGADGLDEITTTGSTAVYEVDGEEIREAEWSPADFGVKTARRSDLQGGDPVVNREIALAVLSGASGPQRDIVLVNSAAALVAAGRAPSLPEAMVLAAKSIDCGSAKSALDRLTEFTNRVS